MRQVFEGPLGQHQRVVYRDRIGARVPMRLDQIARLAHLEFGLNDPILGDAQAVTLLRDGLSGSGTAEWQIDRRFYG